MASDEEVLDSVIEQAIKAYDKQNFVNKGFLARILQMQYKFLVNIEYDYLLVLVYIYFSKWNEKGIPSIR